MSAAAATSTLRTVMPLMSMPRMAAATVLGLVGARGELHAAGLAAPADEDLGLDHDRARRRPPGSARRRRAPRATVWATSQSGTGRPWATSRDLASASWIFTRATAPLRRVGWGSDGTASRPRARTDFGTNR